ncbi:unnamed protein product, partial [Dibothriocephalus latus]
GNCVFASGSPFGKVTVNVGGSQKTFQPGQCNNSYIFPGVGLAITACKLRPIADEAFAVAAEVRSFPFLSLAFLFVIAIPPESIVDLTVRVITRRLFFFMETERSEVFMSCLLNDLIYLAPFHIPFFSPPFARLTLRALHSD